MPSPGTSSPTARIAVQRYVYMLASRRHGTLYLGVINNLGRRVWEHKAKLYKGFSAAHGVDRLVWYEEYERCSLLPP